MVPPSIRPTLLLVEDDDQLSEMLAGLLRDAGYDLAVARDGQTGLHLGLTHTYDVMVIDRGLPAIEGSDLVARLRRQGVATPILMLTARGTVADRIHGLDAGAEDYLVKPFDVDELLARVRALHRRHQDRAESISLGSRLLLVNERRVVAVGIDVDGSGAQGRGAGGTSAKGIDDVDLSGRECELLRVLASRPNRVFTRDELIARVFDDAETPGAVDTYVHYLRRKLGKECVRTVHGMGYRIGSI